MPTNFNKSLTNEIKAASELITRNERATSNLRVKIQCDCSHRDANNAFVLMPLTGQHAKKSPYTNNPLFRCKICGAYIDIGTINEADIKIAIDRIWNLLNVTKMRLDPTSEKDAKLRKRIAKLLYRQQTLVPDCYKMIQRSNNKKKKKSGSGGSIMQIG